MGNGMLVARLIERKREGLALEPDEWSELIRAYTEGEVPDYQMSALIMAAFLKGLEESELLALTDAMVNSGSHMQFPAELRCVDKHSTGGVGDKTSLILAPLVASCNVPVPMMSGRGLGHTTGTLDKLESIPGFRTDLSIAEAVEQVQRIGCALLGQTDEIAPADRKLYALRDATATVSAIPFIAASIMSKKLAEGLVGLVLDVKRGSGAFMPEVEDALELAQTMIALGEKAGCRTVALLTAMDRPLGRACGNALETKEAIEALKGDAPPDLMEVTLALSAEMLVLGEVAPNRSEARRELERSLATGRAFEKMSEIVEAQGGDPEVMEDPGRLPHAPHAVEVTAKFDGYVEAVEPRAIGEGIVGLGGGRRHVQDRLDPAVGFEILVRPGDRVSRGQPLARIHARDQEGVELGRRVLEQAVRVGSEPTGEPSALISHRVTLDEVTDPV